MKNVFITGVSGYIGQRIARALAENEKAASLVGIDVKEPGAAPDKLTFVRHDVREPVADLLKEHAIDAVVHAAYVLSPLHDQALMEDINISGTRNILAACREASISQLLYLSSATAYGFHHDNQVPLTEESPLRGNDDFTYSKNKKEIEFLMEAFVKERPDMKVTVLRPCFVVGPGFDNPLARHMKKRFVLMARKSAPMQFVHEDDLTRIMAMCLEKEIPGVFNVGAEGTLSVPEMIKMLGNTMIALPNRLLYLFNHLSWILRLRFLTEFPSPALNMIMHPWAVASEKLISRTGFEYQYDTRAAFEDFVRHVKDPG